MAVGTLIFTAALAVPLWCVYRFAARRKDFLRTCVDLVDKIPINEYNSIREFIDEKGVDYADFWRRSNRVHGLLKRINTARSYHRIVQAFYKAGMLDSEDAQYIACQLCLLIWFSVRALPEALLCLWIPSYPRIAALASVQVYCNITVTSNVLCVTKEAPECIKEMRKLL